MAFYQEFRFCQVPFILKVGDGVCDNYGMYNTAACNYDNGDCESFTQLYPDCKANYTQYLGDGHCDNHGFFNTEACGFDAGDCIEFNKMYPGCKAWNGSHVGDGYCDSGLYNTKECLFDGGDCDAFNLEFPGCKAEWPLGPEGYYGKPSVGNGWCDLDLLYGIENPSFRTEECKFDGGDCDYFFWNELDVDSLFPNCTTDVPGFIGDGFCDSFHNSHECGFDGGDCDWFNENFPDCLAPDPWRLDYVDEDNAICFGGVYNTPECGYMNGFCDQFNTDHPNCTAQSPSWVGDGVCDGGTYSTPECGFDGGDCVNITLAVEDFPYCFGVKLPSLVGDGKCHGGEYNTEACGWDGYDCLEYNENYPLCGTEEPFEVGDGICNYELATEECGYDGGDCEKVMLFLYGKAVEVSDYRSDTKIFASVQSSFSVLSLVASIAILTIIYRSYEKLSSIINRLLFGLCVADIMSSLAQSFSTLPAPKEFSDIIWNARGNIASCEAQGFFIFVGSVAAPLYNCSLCFYYLAILKFNKKDDFITKKLEPFFHGIPAFVSVTGAIIILAKKAFNPNRTYCYIGPDPTCGNEGCDRMADTRLFFYIFSAAPYIILPSVIVASMISIYRVVLAQEKKTDRFNWRKKLEANVKKNKKSDGAAPHDVSVQALRKKTKSTMNSSGAANTPNSDSTGNKSGNVMSRLFSRLPNWSMKQEPPTDKNKPARRKKQKQSRIVLNTALSYSLAFLLSYIFPMIISIRTIMGLGSGMALSIIARVLFPLQGFFNFCVFIYPHVRAAKNKDNDISWCAAFLKALQSRGPKKKASRDLRSTRKTRKRNRFSTSLVKWFGGSSGGTSGVTRSTLKSLRNEGATRSNKSSIPNASTVDNAGNSAIGPGKD